MNTAGNIAANNRQAEGDNDNQNGAATTAVQEDLEDALLAMSGAAGPTQGRQLLTNASRTTWIL